MEAQQDFKELLELFNKHRVEYVVVGAYALAFHGSPRFTGDIDLLVRASAPNAAKIMVSLDAFGFGSLDIATDDFVKEGWVVQLGVPPVRIDLMTSISGVTWEEVDAGKAGGAYGGVPVFYLGRHEYIRNKKAIGRAKDLADIEALGEF